MVLIVRTVWARKLLVPVKNSGELQWHIIRLGIRAVAGQLLILRTFVRLGMQLSMLLRGSVTC